MLNSVYGLPVFIGQEREIAQFEALLADTSVSEKWLMYLIGDGGVGKTQLLQRFVESAEKQRSQGRSIMAADGLIDLYWTANQSELGILRSIANRLGRERFGGFLDALERYESLFSRQFGPAAELFEERLAQTRNAFFTAYRNLPAQKIVLFFDTAENSTDAVRLFWQETLPKLKQEQHGTLVVLAGRPPVIKLPEDQTILLDIAGFTPREVAVYLGEHAYQFEQPIIARITTLSRGRPILIALTVDWLQVGYGVDQLVDCSPSEFERLMIRRVQELRYDEDQAILAMAHLYRRCDAQILAHILELPAQEAEELVQDVAKFSFVKYRPPTDGQPGSCLLHDEMRDLVNKYVWSELDPLEEYRRGWDRKIVDYYSNLIAADPSALEQQNLSLERLAYWLDADIAQAFGYSEQLFQAARTRRDTNFMEAINTEVARVQNRQDSSLTATLEYRKALVLHGRGHYEQAQQKLNPLLDDSAMNLLQAAVRVQVVESMIYGGELLRAIQLGEAWLTWFAAARDTCDPAGPLHQQLENEFGKLCNNIGLAYRNQNKLLQTIEYYERSLEHFGRAGSAYPEIANTKNNLGYVFHRLGRDDEALSHCEASLAIRQRLGAPEQLGYSYNVMAMIYVDQLRQHDAETYFKRAREEFTKAESQRGRGLVNVAYGRALRQLGRHKERNMDEAFDPQRAEYKHAEQMLVEAIDIFRQLNDEPNLSEALNEMGTLRRQQRQWQLAIEHFQESVNLAQRIGNAYRRVDNLVDIAITYDYWGNLDLALKYADQASNLALDEQLNLQAFNLFAKAQEVRANALFHRKDYESAFTAIADACIFIMRLDNEKLGESPAKRELYYNEKLDWAAEKILDLPNEALVHNYTAYLISRWREEKIGSKYLAESYPGFIIRMRDLGRNFTFLRDQ